MACPLHRSQQPLCDPMRKVGSEGERERHPPPPDSSSCSSSLGRPSACEAATIPFPRQTRDPEACRRGSRGRSTTHEALSGGCGTGSGRPAITAIIAMFQFERP